MISYAISFNRHSTVELATVAHATELTIMSLIQALLASLISTLVSPHMGLS